MFEIAPEPEFSTWFEALSEPLAEEVAGALEVIASAGTALDPTRVSRALLVYDGTGTGTELGFFGRFVEPFAEIRDLMLWQQEITRCLESAAFVTRLGALSRERAELALSAVVRLKDELHASRVLFRLGAGVTRGAAAHPLYVLPTREARALGELDPVRDVSSKLEKLFHEVLGLVGLLPSKIVGSGSGLRELTLTNTSPRLHVLFGLDFEARRLIAMLGEALDRAYYGDSVKFAEARWSAYLSRRAASESSPR